MFMVHKNSLHHHHTLRKPFQYLFIIPSLNSFLTLSSFFKFKVSLANAKNSQVARFANLSEDPSCSSVIKESAYAFSSAYIELWMHLGSSERTQKARVALGCASSYSCIVRALKPAACIHNSIYAR